MTNSNVEHEDLIIIKNGSFKVINLLSILNRQKKIVIMSILTILLLTVTYLFLTKQVYESRAVIAIGRAAQQSVQQNTLQQSIMQQSSTPIGTFEEPLQLVQRLKEKFKVGDITEGGKTMPMLTSIEIDPKMNNLITLKAQAYSSKEAQEYLVGILSCLLEEHGQLYSKNKAIQENRILLLEQELQDIDKEINELAGQSKAQVKNDSAMAALILIEKIKLGERRLELQKQLKEVMTEMSEINTKPTELLREPTMPVNPTKSRLIIIVFAIVIASLMGLILALIKEYFDSRNKIVNVK